MSDLEDVDKRFNELTAQIDRNEQRKMNKAAAQEWARLPRVRRRRNRRIAAFAVVAVVAGAGLFVAYRPEVVSMIPGVVSERFSNMGMDALRLGQVPEETAPVDVRPPKLSPFEGSPAKNYADGAKGLVMPAARATGGLSRKDVATALQRTRDMLKASHLDRKTLMGGKPTALTKLLHPEQRVWFLKNLDRRSPKKNAWDSRYWVTSLAPKTAELATDVIKVKGRTKYSGFREDGRSGVRIRVNYLFVYAIHRPGRPEPTQRIIAHNLGEIHAYRENGELVIWLADWNADGVAGARCDINDAFTHPFYDDSVPDKEALKATGAPVDPYDLDDNVRDEKCSLTTGT
ncbi:hypothetical protein [Streptosporangium sp. 'caverna']|uniref:hypothetical protein n=1 Tax=Streptosporangium sp. 'caverna' TaxID=2202249 RepID=UPI000D7E6189|nr:hypothetical protein [Streptosporangium sp. 'caverna']AWS41893.1 hypothetical protein DKM19_11515 [Streptosporangium sp. 'caverna']